MEFASSIQARLDQVEITPRRRDATHGLLLEAMQNVDGFDKPNRVYGAVGVAVVVFNDFQDSRTVKASKRLGIGMFAAILGNLKRRADSLPNRPRKLPQVVTAGPNPDD